MKHPFMYLCALGAMLLTVGAAAQELRTQPEDVILQKMDQAVSVEVVKGTNPVAITKVNSHQFNVGKNTYEYMVSVTAQDGKLVIKPTDLLEIGSYVLTVNTNAGTVVTDVYATLSSEPDSLEARSARAGVSKEQMKALLGLSSENPREAVELQLPPFYYEGQTLVLTMRPNPNRTFTWTVNGKVVREGANENELVYTFREPGEYVVTYSERDNGQIVASGVGATTVRPLPPTLVEVASGADVVMRAPDGYRKYTWTLNGNTLGTGRELVHRFPAAGVYNVEVLGEEPVAGPYDQFLRTRYRVTVR